MHVNYVQVVEYLNSWAEYIYIYRPFYDGSKINKEREKSWAGGYACYLTFYVPAPQRESDANNLVTVILPLPGILLSDYLA